MCIEINKCEFSVQETKFLGYIISRKELTMDPDKAKAITEWPRPTNRKEVQQILGPWNFYR